MRNAGLNEAQAGIKIAGNYKQCCDEHWGTCVSFNSGFLRVYAQKWDCWVMMLNITHYQRNANQNHNEVPLHTSQNGCDPKICKQ